MNIAFVRLIEKYIYLGDLSSFDPYDVWNTKFGQAIKRYYYGNKWIGTIPASVMTMYDFFINNSFRIGYKQRHYPMVYALHALTAIELYKQAAKNHYLEVAHTSLAWLSENYCKGYSGYCWGANMPWVSKNATYTEEIPYITNTPYALEAFHVYRSVTRTQEFDHIIESVFDFVEKDLNVLINTETALALSYSPAPEKRVVINANSYAMFCYSVFYSLFPERKAYIADKIQRLYSFIRSAQQADGSWFYFADGKEGNFIDCFHSCFVIKNLIKVSSVVALPGSEAVINNGYAYLKQNFWDDKKQLFRRFSVTDRWSLVKYDLYDNAEMLNLAAMMNDKALQTVLLQSVPAHFQHKSGIYSQILIGYLRINKDMLRWAVMPYLLAVAKSLKV